MAVHRRVTKIGGSLGVLVPRDLAEAMGIAEGSHIRLSLVGRQMVIEPEDDTMSDAVFQHAFATVLRRDGPAFQALADYDQGRQVGRKRRRCR